jgi:hypothetical protein
VGGVIDRQQPAQQRQPDNADLRDFPCRTLSAGDVWWRQHRASAGPWWFSSDGSGRFDLEPPNGTCYLASSASAAIRERVGPDMIARGAIPASLLTGRVVSRLRLPEQVHAANLDAVAAAKLGVSRELAVTVPYTIPQAWAAALAATRFDGIVANLRFSPGRSVGLALFGKAGERVAWPGDDKPTRATIVAARMQLMLLEAPSLTELTIATPPRT